MAPVTIDFDLTTVNYISKKTTNMDLYIINLVREDMLLNSINESKKSGIYRLNNLDDLDK